MDPREMLARLNPTNVRFDVGRGGGVPELTNIDIAGALGMVPAGLGRDLMEYKARLRGDRTRGERDRITGRLYQLAMAEWGRRSHAHCEARVNLGLSSSLATFNRDRSESMRRHLSILTAKVAVARDMLWPEALSEKLPVMATVLIDEFCGEPRPTNEEMAKRMGIKTEAGFRITWSPVYLTLLDLMREEEQEAAYAFKRALRRDAA